MWNSRRSTGSCSLPVSAPWRRADRSGSAAKPTTRDVRRNGGVPPALLAERCGRTGICRRSNGTGSRRCAATDSASVRSAPCSGGLHRRSAVSCAATPQLTTSPTTAVSRTCEPGLVLAGLADPDCAPTPRRGGLSRKLRTGRAMRQRHRRSDQRRSRFMTSNVGTATRIRLRTPATHHGVEVASVSSNEILGKRAAPDDYRSVVTGSSTRKDAPAPGAVMRFTRPP